MSRLCPFRANLCALWSPILTHLDACFRFVPSDVVVAAQPSKGSRQPRQATRLVARRLTVVDDVNLSNTSTRLLRCLPQTSFKCLMSILFVCMYALTTISTGTPNQKAPISTLRTPLSKSLHQRRRPSGPAKPRTTYLRTSLSPSPTWMTMRTRRARMKTPNPRARRQLLRRRSGNNQPPRRGSLPSPLTTMRTTTLSMTMTTSLIDFTELR
ncbi:hypothetical protein P153DRAFT_152300 [Dothidotthia symphoricarpi CBS 119687]|uniref:Uncharacterized protein n=1 Tax=Dothidotthia symphoricarpi CBS 119687 TaxID=1392245 RepID=A0A6A6ART0_9PLEO|nr:uncharacterized protein P153DRAFT_152300 [Dothidotthia symphoricarpi CBS 119687]KAF2133231.1 hypothetical protein P153DRAFT_152300 [Dothidotthia symphoricarpi CBS 119687]